METNKAPVQNEGAKGVTAFLRKAVESPWNIAGIAIGAFTGTIGLIAQSFSKDNPVAITIAATFGGGFIGLLIYCFFHLTAFKKLYEQQMETSRVYAASLTGLHQELNRSLASLNAREHELEHIKDFNRKADNAFSDLSRERTKFDSAVLHYLTVAKDDRTSLDHANRDLDSALASFMTSICDVAVGAVAARKLLPADLFEANIKLIHASEKGSKINRYETAARSRNTSPRRRRTDRNAKPDYIAQRNGFFSILMRDGNDKGHIIVENIGSQIRRWKSESGEAVKEPTIAAEDFYTSCVCVSISGDKYAANGRGSFQNSIKINESDVLLGSIFLDSKLVIFDESEDLSIMDELSLNVYSALRSFNGAKELVRKGVYG